MDYEDRSSYEVTLTAEDSFGDSVSIAVTITVTDMDEAPEIMEGGLSIRGRSTVNYAENGMGSVATYTAAGPDADMATWSLGGDDAGAFSISSAGMLMFSQSPDYEKPTDTGMDNTYMVTVMADDGTNMDSHAVRVMVTNVDEPGEVVTPEPGDTLLDRYDKNNDGQIDRPEVLDAIRDFVFNQTIEREDVVAVIRLFVFGR